MLVVDTSGNQEEIVGVWTDHVQPGMPAFRLKMMEEDDFSFSPQDILTNGMQAVTVTRRSITVPIDDMKSAFEVTSWDAERVGIDLRHMGGTDSVRSAARALASRLFAIPSVLILLDDPESRVFLDRNMLNDSYRFNVTSRVLKPRPEDMETIFDNDLFVPIDPNRYGGELSKTSANTFKPSTISASKLNAFGLYDGMTIRRPESIVRITNIA